MTRRLGALAVLLAAIAGLAAVLAVAPDSVLLPSLPHDDAWAHAAHARSLSATGHFEPATEGLPGGPASPLWATVMAVPHLLTSDMGTIVLLIKLAGFALHALAALMLFQVLADRDGVSPEGLLGPLLVAFHPDLISASLSGVEPPLATVAACGLLWAAHRAPAWGYGAVAMAIPFVRPDLALLAPVFPAVLYARNRGRLWRLEGAAVGGTLAAFGLMAAHLLPRSTIPAQRPLPGAMGAEYATLLGREVFGFTKLFDQLPIVDAGLIVVAAGIAAAHVAFRMPVSSRQAIASSAMLGGLGLCLVSFASLTPVVSKAFDTQRHALPALPLLVGAIPILVYEGARRVLPRHAVTVVRIALPLLLASSEVLDAPVRYRQLANDALNVDDVHVAMGRVLGQGPAGQVVWASAGGGALRYFGRATVVDLSAADTRIAPDGQPMLDDHRPHFIEIAPPLSSIEGESARALPAISFTTRTPDTLDGTLEARHQRWLVACVEGGRPLRLRTADRVVGLRCAEGGIARAAGGTR